CESVAGVGSVFTVRLPFAVAGGSAQERGGEGGARFKGEHVLLVEDNPFNRKVALALLERAGLRVTVAENGAEAVAKVRCEAFDLVLMDVSMPVMDGLAAAREIRALDRPGAASLPILAVSANAMETDVAASLAAGMNAHIAKPFTPETLYGAVAAALQGGGPSPEGSEVEAPRPRLVPKVDLETGVRLTGGDLRLYRELLGQFEVEYRDRCGEIERQALAGNLEEAARLAHAVKGIAGVLAAKPLQEAAQRLETALRGGADFSGELGAFREELRLTLAFISAGEGDACQPPLLMEEYAGRR
ncbi:MAG TPA: response regulator, partial [Anaeromyxobacteraceae bacterium]|nr:response regulator [Anaeromyxobacteraceae bacterium]